MSQDEVYSPSHPTGQDADIENDTKPSENNNSPKPAENNQHEVITDDKVNGDGKVDSTPPQLSNTAPDSSLNNSNSDQRSLSKQSLHARSPSPQRQQSLRKRSPSPERGRSPRSSRRRSPSPRRRSPPRRRSSSRSRSRSPRRRSPSPSRGSRRRTPTSPGERRNATKRFSPRRRRSRSRSTSAGRRGGGGYDRNRISPRRRNKRSPSNSPRRRRHSPNEKRNQPKLQSPPRRMYRNSPPTQTMPGPDQSYPRQPLITGPPVQTRDMAFIGSSGSARLPPPPQRFDLNTFRPESLGVNQQFRPSLPPPINQTPPLFTTPPPSHGVPWQQGVGGLPGNMLPPPQQGNFMSPPPGMAGLRNPRWPPPPPPPTGSGLRPPHNLIDVVRQQQGNLLPPPPPALRLATPPPPPALRLTTPPPPLPIPDQAPPPQPPAATGVTQILQSLFQKTNVEPPSNSVHPGQTSLFPFPPPPPPPATGAEHSTSYGGGLPPPPPPPQPTSQQPSLNDLVNSAATQLLNTLKASSTASSNGQAMSHLESHYSPGDELLSEQPHSSNSSKAQGKSGAHHVKKTPMNPEKMQQTRRSQFATKQEWQERIALEVKSALKPHYMTKSINKNQYKEILKKCVIKISQSSVEEIHAEKIAKLANGYVQKYAKQNSH